MRKVFTLLLFTVLATIGMRAQEEVTGNFGTSSSYSIVSRVMTITINSTDDYKGWVNDGWGTTQVNLVNNNNVSKVVFKTGNDVTIPSDCASSCNVWYWIGNVSDKVNTIDFRNCAFVDNKVTGLNLNYKNFNVIVPDACESASSFFTGDNTHNYFKVSSTTLYASLNGSVTVVWDNVKNECTTLAIEGTVSTALDLSASGFTNFNFYNTTVKADITVPNNSTVKVSTDEAKEHIKGNDVTIDYTAPAEPFNGTLTSIGGSVSSAITDYNKDNSEQISAADVKYLEVTGTLTADDYVYIKNNLIKLVGIKLPDTYAVFPSEFSELSIKFATSDNAGVWVKNTEEGGLSAAINDIPSDWISSAKKISVSGPMNATDMSAFSISTLKGIEIINLYDATVSDKSYYSSFSVDNSHTNVALVLAGQVTADEIKTINIGYTYKIWAIYSYSYESTMLNAWLKLSGDFSKIADCAFLAVPSVKTLSISLDDGKSLTQNDIKYFNGYKNVVNLLMERARLSEETSFSDINNDMKRVLLPDESDPKKFTYDGSSIKIGQSYRNNNEYIYVVEAGSLNNVPHYTNDNIKKATCIHLLGEINDDDITGFINEIQNNAISLAQAEYNGTDLTCIDNDNIEYLALPKNCLALEVTDKDNFNYQSNVNLIGVGVLMEEGNAENTVQTLHTYTKYNSDKTKKGEIAALIEMMGLSEKKYIKKIVFSGYLDASDIGGYVQGGYSIGTDGHLYHETIKTKPEDMKTNNSGDLSGATPESADFSKAYFKEPFDMCINGSCIATYKEIKLPLTMTEIPENFITGCSKITELYIPYGYETVGKNALLGCNISRIYTDETKNDDGTKYMAGNNGDHTMTLPASLKKICTGAFAISDNVDIYDVYILAETAPICEMDAFSSAMYFNNNSYNPTTPITAESYQKGGGTSSMSVLHFPTKCNTENVKKYTDPTREYTLADGLATTDANGNLLYWPNQSEFNTAYTQAVTGYTWKSWKIERVTYSTEIGNCLIPSGTSGSDVKDGAQEEAYAKFQENGSPADTQYWTASSEEDYRGWHQFVLTSFSKSKNEDPTFNFGYITDNDWWTICLPFDMTKAKLKEVYGENTKVCTLVNVVRSYNGSDANYPKNSVTLVFGNNLMEKTDDPKTLTVNDEDVVIKAGYPYMIKPSLSTKQMENPKELLVFSDPSYATKLEGEKTAAYKILTTEKNIKARKETLNGEFDNDYTYKFIGSFVPYYMPQHSYFLGWDTKQNGVAFFYQAEMPSSNIKNWNAYTCVIGVNWDNPTWVEATAKDVSHWETYTVSGSNMISVSKDDSFPSAANGKITNMQFGTGETDAIETVHMGNKTVTFVSGRVYNLNGQVVGENGNIDHLGKGIYVVNGKKFVVK